MDVKHLIESIALQPNLEFAIEKRYSSYDAAGLPESENTKYSWVTELFESELFDCPLECLWDYLRQHHQIAPKQFVPRLESTTLMDAINKQNLVSIYCDEQTAKFQWAYCCTQSGDRFNTPIEALLAWVKYIDDGYQELLIESNLLFHDVEFGE